jgi:hypothetical protein
MLDIAVMIYVCGNKQNIVAQLQGSGNNAMGFREQMVI